MDSLIDKFEDSLAVAVLFVNPSENIQLDDTFVTHREETVRIPMFSTSLQSGNRIKNISSTTSSDVECQFMLVSQGNGSCKQ